MADATNWIDLDGAANARDLGGLPLARGGAIIAHRLLRSDNLQELTARDVRTLIDEYELGAVVDLRTKVEVTTEGPTRLSDERQVQYLNASLFAEEEAVVVPDTDAGPVVLPWQNRQRGEWGSAAEVYLSYLTERPESVIAALRLIASCDGAAVVHCAAGKDRTGVVIALALDAVGGQREAIIDEYARTADRLPALLARLAASPTYAGGIRVDDPDRHTPRPDTMRDFLSRLDTDFGGSGRWLATHGWTGADQAALEAKLTRA